MVKVAGISEEQLRSIVERIEKLEEEKAAIGQDIREIYAEAKGNGFDVKAIREIVKLRKLHANEREEKQMVLDTYLRALGMLPEFDTEDDDI